MSSRVSSATSLVDGKNIASRRTSPEGIHLCWPSKVFASTMPICFGSPKIDLKQQRQLVLPYLLQVRTGLIASSAFAIYLSFEILNMPSLAKFSSVWTKIGQKQNLLWFSNWGWSENILSSSLSLIKCVYIDFASFPLRHFTWTSWKNFMIFAIQSVAWILNRELLSSLTLTSTKSSRVSTSLLITWENSL